jgi:hypothetical protein
MAKWQEGLEKVMDDEKWQRQVTMIPASAFFDSTSRFGLVIRLSISDAVCVMGDAEITPAPTEEDKRPPRRAAAKASGSSCAASSLLVTARY